MSQSNERKAAPREVKKPLATVPPPAIYILSKNSPRSLNIQVELTSLTSLASVSTSALLDSRATGMFINQSFMQKHQLETTLLPQPILMRNVNSSPNENGSVTEEVHITLHFGCCKQDNWGRAAPKSQLRMYKLRPGQMGTSNS